MPEILETRVHARAGLLGNPSDGYHGKTLACLVANFRACVRFEESARLRLTPNPRFDPLDYADLNALADACKGRRYYGGLRLMQAACVRFHAECGRMGLALKAPPFTAGYDSDIPLQAGLSGSSAIVIAFWKALLRWHGVEGRFDQRTFPGLALETETVELGITAGMQDRVVQTYGGLLTMDFDRALMEGRGYGEYRRLDPALLPPLYLAHGLDSSDSGGVHSDVRRRFDAGDPEVVEAMRRFAGFAEEGVRALEAGRKGNLGPLMDSAFGLRRRIFGDAVLGRHNLRMVELARRFGLSGTTSGSGGAIVGPQGDEGQNRAFAHALEAEGYHYVRLQVGPELSWERT